MARSGDWDLDRRHFRLRRRRGFPRHDEPLVSRDVRCRQSLPARARWKSIQTPLNNPGVTSGDLGFNGDCLQTRVIVNFGQPDEKVTHLTCWRGKDGRDVIKVELGRTLHDGMITDLKTLGARQAFTVAEDGRHYTQEIAIPWSLLARSGKSPGPGAELAAGHRSQLRGRQQWADDLQGLLPARLDARSDLHLPGGVPVGDREGSNAKGHQSPPRPVRLSDNREFPAHMQGGAPVIDWTGLVQKSELASIKSIPFDMPEDGYASIVLKAADGSVVRHLANCEKFSTGHHELKWDGLRTTPTWKRPGDPVPAGTYQAAAIYHQGIGMRLKGWADNSGQTPWDFPAQKGNWGGDHGTPAAVAADGQRVYLGWTAAEAGKALVACDLAGRPVWNHTRGGIGGARAVAVDSGTVYALDRVTLYRVDSTNGQYTTWQGTDSTAELPQPELFENVQVNRRDDRFGADRRPPASSICPQNWPARSWCSIPPRAAVQQRFECSQADGRHAFAERPTVCRQRRDKGSLPFDRRSGRAEDGAYEGLPRHVAATSSRSTLGRPDVLVGCGDPGQSDQSLHAFRQAGQNRSAEPGGRERVVGTMDSRRHALRRRHRPRFRRQTVGDGKRLGKPGRVKRLECRDR